MDRIIELFPAILIVINMFLVLVWVCLKSEPDTSADILSREEIRNIGRK